MSVAVKWDGQGPKRECLLLVQHEGVTEWTHFDWRDADAEPDGEGGWNGNPDEYFSESIGWTVARNSDPWRTSDDFEPSADFVVTHWAELPEVTS